MAKVTPRQFAEKLVNRARQSTAEMERGVDRVTVAPGEKAAAQADKMLENIIESIRSGRWASAVGAVSLQDWKTSMKEKGIPRVSQGLQAAQPKIERFAAKLLPVLDQIQAEVEQMPDRTLEDRIARSAHVMRRLNEMKGQFKG